jgi:hypothetical protein
VAAIECDLEGQLPKDLLRMVDVARLEYECFAAYGGRFGKLTRFND